MTALIQAHPTIVNGFALFGFISFILLLLCIAFFAWVSYVSRGPTKQDEQELADFDVHFLLHQLTDGHGHRLGIDWDNDTATEKGLRRGITVNADWTGWTTMRFHGETIRDALRAAYEEKRRITKS